MHLRVFLLIWIYLYIYIFQPVHAIIYFYISNLIT